MNVFTLLTIVFISISNGCAPAEKSSEERATDPGVDSTGTDQRDDEPADIPVEVAGAYLTAFGTPQADAATVQAGFRPVGINLFEALTGKKTNEMVQVLEVSYEVAGEIFTAVPLKQNNGTWHAIFEVPDSTPAPILGITVTLVIDELSPLQLISQTYTTYDAEAGGAPDFASEISAQNLIPVPVLKKVGEHLLFVTNGRYRPAADFISAADANRLCNRESNAESVLNSFWWKAVLADDIQTIDQRIVLNGQVKNLDGEKLIAQGITLNASVLTTGLLQFANYGAIGARTGDYVFTGVNKDGSLGNTCSNWTVTDETAVGGNAASGSGWLSGSEVSCGSAQRLYCISTKEKRTDESTDNDGQ